MSTMTQQRHAEITDEDTDALIVMSTDSHVGPKLEEQLRPYCPRQYLDDFDAFAVAYRQSLDRIGGTPGLRPGGMEFNPDPAIERNRRALLNLKTAGHYDMDARFVDLDRDGIAAELLFHGSLNEEPIPFATSFGYAPQDA